MATFVHLKKKRLNEDHASHDYMFEFQLQSDAWSLCSNAVHFVGLLFFPVDRSFLWGMFVKVNAIFVGVVPSARDVGDEKCHHGLE